MTVYFIGAGPGAADLLTLRAHRILSEAPVVLYAGSIVPEEVLESLAQDATVVNTARMPLEEIINTIAQADREGKDVARLHSGDPSIYSAVAEQARRLTELGIAYQIVPGVPAFAAVAASLGHELTVPTVGQTVILTRVQGRASAMPEGEDLATLGASKATLCIHLAAHDIERVVAELTPNYGEDCPAAVVAYASRENEQIVRGTLGDIAQKVREANIQRTAVIVVGRVLGAEGFPDSFLYSDDRPRDEHGRTIACGH
ncbi:precorrin-4 C(11)-methyltransferase [Corynebacterium sp. 153RC1]|uniref:precorrin-4 C(11)-methyltransferase n=1 Tax=unclassified Corynebacterium TaxID=2624378 RepID=UPI00211CA84A|nr:MULTISPECIES: precorrin-4 C(11)-methyltransferase [unclassified Corynebacterium]MCQ9370230.1 precorrin-4 C(11)-methyltransferase [Corynebacterium sp. 35RC1]MCQ9352453.1 precorrin-4 C(11)-methyltransferase [Corynebacterium sp. 209RC1]MCQ9354375.1 precorrin-4 C(11)-methyltransferase [Corynebacterium sp. 1222RC1]MCQ9356736.1 precorrin-4 C(11)-methyltransferase [Corynebacterium sp. 122RC1]MCQ9358770.1 precorrin-4 C(11)-methyltransferase [Corynebacterium sp. 142RC1]